MRLIFLFITAFSVPCQALICGFYQVEDFNERVLYFLTVFDPPPPKGYKTLFTITNPSSPAVNSMIRGMCYCVEGQTQVDPEFEGDENFQLLTVENVEGTPFVDCTPFDKSSY